MDIYDFTSLIGPNNCGKSSIIRAIEIFLAQEKPSPQDWRDGCEDKEIIIEGHFCDLKEWERNCPGVAGLVNESEIKLRLRAKITPDKKIETTYEAFIKQYDIDGWSTKWSELSPHIKEVASSLEITTGNHWKTSANKERVREQVLRDNPELTELIGEDWTDENISITPALKQALPKPVVIPAVKDALDEIKPTSTTAFGTLLSTLILPAIEDMDEYRSLMSTIDNLSKKLSGELDEHVPIISDLTEEITSRMSSIIEAKVKITMSTPDTNKFVGNNTTILMDDGTETTIDRQGHGSQRSLIFALIEVLANRSSITEDNQNNKSTILLFEEPELYLHPHLMARLKNALRGVSEKDQWQVLISTHSPFLVDVVENPMSLVILNRKSPNESPYTCQLKEDPFSTGTEYENEKDALRASLDFHPTVNRAFFAKRVVLVEGDTEIGLFNHRCRLHEHYGIDEKIYNNTTIVSCGGKWTIIPFAKLLNAFKIPFRIVHDLDRKGKSDQELEEISSIDPYSANEKIRVAANGQPIFQIEDTLENLIWEEGENIPSKDKPYRTWKRIDELSKNKDELEKFPRLKNLFEFVYAN